MDKPGAFLFGPFVGSLNWELYYFSPFCNFVKYSNPHISNVIYTRYDRFDLYGSYANIIVPLRLQNDNEAEQNCFKLNTLNEESYTLLKDRFYKQYEKRFTIKHHYYPNIRSYNYKVKWQFSRANTTFRFKPRSRNHDYAKSFFIVDKPIILVDLTLFSEEFRHSIIDRMMKNNFVHTLFLYDKNIFSLLTDISISEKKDPEYKLKNHIIINLGEATLLGILMSLIPLSILHIGNILSPYTHLSVLMKKKTFSMGSNLGEDQLNLLNPVKTKLFETKSLVELMSMVGSGINENYI